MGVSYKKLYQISKNIQWNEDCTMGKMIDTRPEYKGEARTWDKLN